MSFDARESDAIRDARQLLSWRDRALGERRRCIRRGAGRFNPTATLHSCASSSARSARAVSVPSLTPASPRTPHRSRAGSPPRNGPRRKTRTACTSPGASPASATPSSSSTTATAGNTPRATASSGYPAVVEECFFNFRDAAHLQYIDDRETLYGKVDDTGFHPRLDDAIVAAFERLDREVKAEDESGTTAAVIFLRKGAANVPGFAAGDVIVQVRVGRRLGGGHVPRRRAVLARRPVQGSASPSAPERWRAFRNCTTNWRATARSWTETRRSTLPSAVEGRTNKLPGGGGSPRSPASSAENSARAGNKSGKKGRGIKWRARPAPGHGGGQRTAGG